MNWGQYINGTTFYCLSLIVTVIFANYYYQKTFRKNRDIYWFIYEDGDKRFDFGGFCKKIFTQLIIIFFASFTFINVVYFCIAGKWVTENGYQSTRSFVIIGAFAYILDLIEKSISIVYDHKQKKIKISQGDTKKENVDKPNNK